MTTKNKSRNSVLPLVVSTVAENVGASNAGRDYGVTVQLGSVASRDSSAGGLLLCLELASLLKNGRSKIQNQILTGKT